MKIKIIIALILLAIAGLLFSSGIFAREVKIKIIVTSDLHGSLLPYDYLKRTNTNNSLASAATYIQQQRADTTCHVLLLDNGDVMQGQPLVYYSNYYLTNIPNIVPAVFNYLGYHAATIGNHDIETGHAVYDKVVSESGFPWLAANAVNTSTGQPYFKPYIVIEKHHVRIAVIGLTTPAIPNWLPPAIYAGIQFDDMVEAAGKWVEYVRKYENPDVVVGLFHSGIDYEYNGYRFDSYKNENAAKLVAMKVAGFDIIFSGHDHSPMCDSVTDPKGKQVYLLNPGGNAELVAVATLKLKEGRKNYRISSVKTGLVAVEKFDPDPDFINHFAEFHQKTIDYINYVAGNLSAPVNSADALFGPCPLINLIHAVQLGITGAEVSFTAPFSLNVKIDSGRITVADLFQMYRFDNLLYVMELTGEEIKNYLEFSYSLWLNTMKSETDQLLLFKKDSLGNIIGKLQNPVYNLSSAFGIDYTVDVTQQPGNRVTITSMTDGKPFEPQRRYRVAINSYRAHGGGNHITQGCRLNAEEIIKRIVFSGEKDIRYYLIEWFEKYKTVTPPSYSNWKIIPENYVEKAKPEALSLLFPK